MSEYFGYHLLLDCSGCEKIDNREHIYNWIKYLVPTIDMIAAGEPWIEYLLEDDPKQGYTLMQAITTSSITAHFMELDGTAYIDIFSCKPFDINLAQYIVQTYFNPKKIRVNYLTRHAD